MTGIALLLGTAQRGDIPGPIRAQISVRMQRYGLEG
jgi:hypothetical protein